MALNEQRSIMKSEVAPNIAACDLCSVLLVCQPGQTEAEAERTHRTLVHGKEWTDFGKQFDDVWGDAR